MTTPRVFPLGSSAAHSGHATLIVLSEYRTRTQRLLHPLTAPHHAAALVQVACAYALWPLSIACAAVAGYAEAQRAVLFPGGRK